MPANAGNFTCSSQVKRSHTQFTCVTCSLHVKTVEFTCVEAASTSPRIHAKCLQVHVNLFEDHGHFTGNFTYGTHANLYATSMQKNTCNSQATIVESQVRIPAKRRQKYLHTEEKIPAIPHRNTCNCRHSAITQRVNSTANCRCVSLHHAGEVTCKVCALLSAITCILCEVLAT